MSKHSVNEEDDNILQERCMYIKNWSSISGESKNHLDVGQILIWQNDFMTTKNTQMDRAE